ncbi:L-amino acid N-acyltransferase YncA [Actimicrobium sp. GrIS 1.19]|nr:L-amino acid N-acyltransferase YncA [Actimicrobium sp. GrIS 1.19]
MMIRLATPADAADICAIYNQYVISSTITFEEVAVSVDEMAQRIATIGGALPWYVYEAQGRVLGYAYATPWKARSAYRFSVESTVYVDLHHAKKGIGIALYERLIDDLRARRTHIVLAGIALPNQGSIALHQKLGFMQVAQLREVGRKFDRWVDVGYWELVLGDAPD